MKKLIALLLLLTFPFVAVAKTDPDYLNTKSSPVYDIRASGAKPDDGVDDSVLIQAALNTYKSIFIPKGVWKMDNTVVITMATSVSVYGDGFSQEGTILDSSANSGAVFSGERISGCTFTNFYIRDTTGASTGFAFSASDGAGVYYARNIDINRVGMYGPTLAIDADYPRRLWVSNCIFETKSGIAFRNKAVESGIRSCTLFGTAGSSDTFGVKLVSDDAIPPSLSLLPAYPNPEGINITDTTISNFRYGVDIRDIYDFHINSCYMNNASAAIYISTGLSAAPSPHRLFFNDLDLVAKGIIFAPAAAHSYHARFSGIEMIPDPGTVALTVGNGTNDVRFKSIFCNFFPGSNVFASVGDGCYSMAYDDIVVNSNASGGIIINGTTGSADIRNFSYGGTGSKVYSAGTGVFVNPATPCELNPTFVNIPAGLVGADTIIASAPVTFTNSSMGTIILNVRGTTTGDGITQINFPAGMTVPSGGGWSSQYFYGLASDSSSLVLPFRCATTASGTVDFKTSAGATATIVGSFGSLSVQYH